MTPCEKEMQEAITKAGFSITKHEFFSTDFEKDGREFNATYDDQPHLYEKINGRYDLIIAGEPITPKQLIDCIK